MTKWIAVAAWLAALGGAAIAQQPADRGRDAFLKVCSGCHPVDTATSAPRSRERWQETINGMISLGAKMTDEDAALTLDYLSSQFSSPAAAAPGGRGGRGIPQMPPRPLPGANDKHVVDPVAAVRGRKVYAAECITCHGTHARGSERGADLIRSVLILHDRYGSELGPFLKKGHPTQVTPAAKLTDAQIQDLAHTIHQEVYNTLRAALEIQNVLTGDAKAGAAYFNGDGKCATCHSVTGDLKGIASRMDPAGIQQRFLFPGGGGRGGRGGPPAPSRTTVTVTVTPANGAAITGALLHFDDFNVALRDSAGEYHSFARTPSLKVVKNDPLAAHHQMLDQYTDKNIHDIVAYLETLK